MKNIISIDQLKAIVSTFTSHKNADVIYNLELNGNKLAGYTANDEDGYYDVCGNALDEAIEGLESGDTINLAVTFIAACQEGGEADDRRSDLVDDALDMMNDMDVEAEFPNVIAPDGWTYVFVLA